MRKIVILTGAGAVIPWGAPRTAEITDKLRKDKEFLTTKNQPVGDYLYNELTNFYHANSQDINFEHIIDLIEQLYDYYASVELGAQVHFKSSIAAIFDIKDKIKVMFSFGNSPYSNKSGKRTYFLHIYRHFINLVINEIKKYSSINKSPNTYSKLNIAFQSFLDYIGSYNIRFYTTNYDRIPIQCSNLSFFDGFTVKAKGEQKFNRKKLFKDEYNNCYINLHGSIYFKYKTKETVINSEKIKTGYWICTTNKVNMIDANMKGNKDQMNRHLIGSNIIAGLYKPSRLMITPIYQFYQKFYSDCLNADCIFVIGYSYGDKHLNVAIRDAVMIKKPQIVDINLIRFLKKMSGNGCGSGHEWQKYTGRLKTVCGNRLKLSNSLRKRDTWVDCPQRHIKVYLKGFKKFLMEKEWKNCVIKNM